MTNTSRRHSASQKLYIKRIDKIRIEDLCTAIILISILGYFAVTPLRSTSLRRFFTLIGTIQLYIISILNIRRNRQKPVFYLSLHALLAIIVFGIAVSEQITTNLFYMSACFIALFIVMTADCRPRRNYRQLDAIYNCIVILSIIIILSSFSSSAYLYEDGRYDGQLTLGMTNPNLAGMMIECVFSALFIVFFARKQWILLIPCAFLVYLIIQTGCRSALVEAIGFAIYVFFFRKRKAARFVVIGAILVPILFVPFYLGMSAGPLSSIAFWGKPLFTGREITYIHALSYIRNNWHFLGGNLGEVAFGNTHNAPLCVFCSIGLIGTMVVYGMYIFSMLRLRGRIATQEGNAALFAILVAFLQSSAENMMLVGHFASLTFLYFYLLIAVEEDRGYFQKSFQQKPPEGINEHERRAI